MYILAFVNAIQNVFKTMLKTEVTFGKPQLRQSSTKSNGVSGIVGFTGSIRGSIVACFPLDVATKLIRCFAGADLPPEHPDFADAIGELVNMVAGGAKTNFNEPGVNIGCPSVVIGKEHQIFHQKDAPVIVVPCTCGHGSFVVQIALKAEKAFSAMPHNPLGNIA